MNKKETAALLTFISEVYPKYFKSPSEATVAVWHEMLGDLDGKQVQDAVKVHTRTSVFPPTIADIRQFGNGYITAGEAWKMVDSINWTNRQLTEDLRKTQPIAYEAAECVGGVNITYPDGNGHTNRAHFIKFYEDLVQRDRKKQAYATALPMPDEKKLPDAAQPQLESKISKSGRVIQ